MDFEWIGKMKTKLLIGLIIVAVTQTTFANIPTKPNACPTIATIKSVGIQEAIRFRDKWISVIRKNSFGTNVEWGFALESEFKTNDSNEALKMANDSLTDLNQIGEPSLIKENSKEYWLCSYTQYDLNNSEYTIGITVSPADLTPMPAMARMMRNMR